MNKTSDKTNSKTQQIKAQREAQASAKAAPSPFTAKAPDASASASPEPATTAPDAAAASPAAPAAKKARNRLGVSMRMGSHLKRRANQIDVTAKRSKGWNAIAEAATKADFDKAQEMLASAATLLRDAAKLYAAHPDFSAKGAGGNGGGAAGTKGSNAFEVGSKVNVTERAKPRFAACLDAEELVGLTITAIAKNAKGKVASVGCTTVKGSKVVFTKRGDLSLAADEPAAPAAPAASAAA